MIPLHRFAAIAAAACCVVLVGATVRPRAEAAACPVRGVWEMVSITRSGRDQPLNGFKQMKIVTVSHFAWIGEEPRRDTLPMNTRADTLGRAFIGGGGGSYTATGNTYVEHIEYFNDPTWIGKSWNATCRVEGNRWYHSYPFPQDSTGVPRDSIGHYVEVWQRIE